MQIHEPDILFPAQVNNKYDDHADDHDGYRGSDMPPIPYATNSDATGRPP
jgi:hypothetical protein